MVPLLIVAVLAINFPQNVSAQLHSTSSLKGTNATSTYRTNNQRLSPVTTNRSEKLATMGVSYFGLVNHKIFTPSSNDVSSTMKLTKSTVKKFASATFPESTRSYLGMVTHKIFIPSNVVSSKMKSLKSTDNSLIPVTFPGSTGSIFGHSVSFVTKSAAKHNMTAHNVTQPAGGSPDNFVWIAQAQRFILLYYPPFAILIGFVGNILTVIVMSQKKNLKLTTCVYMIALSVVGNFILMVYALLWSIRNFFPNSAHPILCKSMNFLAYCLFDISTWVLVAMSIDRLIAVNFPLRSLSWCTIRRTKRIIASILILFALKNMHVFFTTNLVYRKELKTSTCSYVSGELFIKVVNWVNTIIGAILPFIILLCANARIIYVIKSQARKSLEMKAHGSARDQSRGSSRDDVSTMKSDAIKHERNARERQMTVKLIMVNFIFLICTLPFFVNDTFWSIYDKNKSVYVNAVYTLTVRICQALVYSNSATYFYIYCVVGSKFRQDLSRVFMCGRGVDGSKSSTPSTISLPSHMADNKDR